MSVTGATSSDPRRDRRAEEASRAAAAAATGPAASTARVGQHVTDVARAFAPRNTVVQEQVAEFLRVRHPDCFDDSGTYLGGELRPPTREELDELAAARHARPAPVRSEVGVVGPFLLVRGGRGSAAAAPPSVRFVGYSAPQEDAIRRAVDVYAHAIRQRMDVRALDDRLGAMGLPQPIDSATIQRITEALHGRGGALAAGDLSRGRGAAEGLVVDTIRTLEPHQAAEVAERVGEELCRGMGIDPSSDRGRGAIRAVRDGMAGEIAEVVRSGPGNQYRPESPLTATTDADAWTRSEAERIEAASGGNPRMRAHLEGQLREAVAMRDWLQRLPRTEQGLRAHFHDMARREGGSRPEEAVRLVVDLRAEVDRCGRDYYDAYLRQAPETRRFIRDEQPSDLSRCR